MKEEENSKATVHRLVIEAKKAVTGLLDGLWRSRYRGRGIDFEELRVYQPGDPVSDISWTHLAAWNRLLIKRYREERDLKIWILFDLSSSIFALGPSRRKRMAEISSLIALSALDQRDRVGLLFFSDRLEKLVLPRKGLGAAELLLRELLVLDPQGKGTDWEIPFAYLNKINPKGGAIVFLLSDFATLPREAPLLSLSKRNELVGIFVEEKLEEQAPPKGDLLLEEAETGRIVSLNTALPSFQKIFLLNQEERQKELLHLFGKSQGALLTVKRDEDPLDSLVNFLKKRKKR